MLRRNRVVVRVRTREGFMLKVWQHVRSGEITPTNWKIQAGYLAGNYLNKKSQLNHEKRAA